MAAGAMAAGAGIGAIGSLVGGSDQATLLDRQAQIQDENASLAISSAKFNADKNSVASTAHLGAMTAGYGASGVTQDSGSVMSVMAASSANAELDRQNTIYGGQVKSIAYENQASFDRMGAQHALQGSYLSALGSVLKGAGSFAAKGKGGAGAETSTVGEASDWADGGGLAGGAMDAGGASAASDALGLAVT